MNSTRSTPPPAVSRILLASLTASVAAAFAACAASDGAVDGCPEGQSWSGRACVDDEGGGGGGGRDGGGGGGTDTDAPDVGEDTVEQDCTPNARACADETTVSICNSTGTGASLTPCASGQTCLDGECLGEVDECTPGQVFSCATSTSLLVCNGEGTGTVEEPCPSDAPNCSAGVCTAQICVAGRRSCDGNNVVICNDDGTETTFVETCETGCNSGQCIDPCAGDGKSYVGCSFVAVDLDNFSIPCTTVDDCLGGACVDGQCEGSDSAAAQQFAVTVSNDADAAIEVTVTSGAGAEIDTRSVAAGELVSIPLPRADVNDSELSFDSYRIESTGPVTVHQFNPQNNSGVFSNDASLLLPATSLGTEYIVLGWPTFTGTGASLKGFVTIAAVTEGTTTVTVTSPVATDAGRGGVPAALAPNVPTNFALERGQVLAFTTSVEGADLTGMEVVASDPVAVFAGSECANVPLDNQYCDHLEEQLIPVDTWDRDFVLARFKPRGREPDIIRILGSVDGTTIRVNPNVAGMDGRTLNRGQIVEFPITQNHIVGATQPISVAQYMVGSSYPGAENGCDRGGFFPPTGCLIPETPSCEGTAIGDPASVILAPVSQFRDEYILLTPTDYQQDFITIVAEAGVPVEVDGVVVSATRAGVGVWEVMQVSVTDGVHTVTSARPFGLVAYGYDCDVSYAYPGGLDLESLR